MKVWNCGNFENIEIGQKVFVGHCGSGHTVFGEYATLTRTTSMHLVFTTESGTTIKTKKDNLCHVIGKAAAQHIFVSTITEREFIHSATTIW